MTIDELLDTLTRSWNAGDSARYGTCFAEDAVFVDVLGRIQRGRATIVAEHQKLFDTIYRDSTFAVDKLDHSTPAPGLDLLRTASVLSVPEGPRAGDTRAVQTKLVRDGVIVAFQNTIVGELPVFAGHDRDLTDRAPLGWRR